MNNYDARHTMNYGEWCTWSHRMGHCNNVCTQIVKMKCRQYCWMRFVREKKVENSKEYVVKHSPVHQVVFYFLSASIQEQNRMIYGWFNSVTCMLNGRQMDSQRYMVNTTYIQLRPFRSLLSANQHHIHLIFYSSIISEGIEAFDRPPFRLCGNLNLSLKLC